jgi:PAS domain S-box-containing protein
MKNKKIKFISFKTRLIIILEVFIITINSFLGYFIWKELSLMTRENSKNRLIAIASSAATLVDSEKHEQIQVEEDEKSEEYQEIRNIFQKLTKANDKVDDIYTIRKLEDDWVFVVGGHETGDDNGDGEITEDEESVGINEEFDTSEIPEVDEVVNGPLAENNLNCDKWGCWLSGYAPFYDREGNFVGAAAVDIAADDIVAFEKKTKMFIIGVVAALIVFFPFFIFLFLEKLTKPISTIVGGLENFGKDFSLRIIVKSRDEFQLIAETSNEMAKELEILYNNLEEKVREKTKALASKVDEIQKEKAKDEALLDSLGEGMIATDRKGKIIIANRQAELLLGYGLDEFIGNYCQKFVGVKNEKGDSVELEKRPDYVTLKTGQKITESKYFYVRNDESVFPVYVTTAPFFFNKKLIGMVMVFHDITRERQIDKAKSEFVSLASHQLRTPLSNINWYSEMILDDENKNLTAKQKGYLLKIYKSNEKMVELVDSLLNVSRIDLGTFTIENKTIDLADFMSNLIEEYEPMSYAKKIEIQSSFDSSVEGFMADPKLLRIIFQNLISNAVKYTPEKGKVSVSFRQKNKEIIFEVSDSGCGIPLNQQNQIFSKLFRADNVKTLETEGTGLGLYILKMIVDEAGGRVSFESKENEGTIFRVVFPKNGMKEKKGSKNLE